MARRARVGRTRLKGASRKYAKGRGFKTSVSSRASNLASQHRRRGVPGAPKLGSTAEQNIAYYSKVKSAKAAPRGNNKATVFRNTKQGLQNNKINVVKTKDKLAFKKLDSTKGYQHVDDIILGNGIKAGLYKQKVSPARVIGRAALTTAKYAIKIPGRFIGNLAATGGALGFLAAIGAGSTAIDYFSEKYKGAKSLILGFVGTEEALAEKTEIDASLAIDEGKDPGDGYIKKLPKGVQTILLSGAKSEADANAVAFLMKDIDLDDPNSIDEFLESRADRNDDYWKEKIADKNLRQDLRSYFAFRLYAKDPAIAEVYASLSAKDRAAIHHTTNNIDFRTDFVNVLATYPESNESARYEEVNRLLTVDYKGTEVELKKYRINHDLGLVKHDAKYYSEKYGYSATKSTDSVWYKLKKLKALYDTGSKAGRNSAVWQVFLAQREQLYVEYGYYFDLTKPTKLNTLAQNILKPPHRLAVNLNPK